MNELTIEMLNEMLTKFESGNVEEQRQVLQDLTNYILKMQYIDAELRETLIQALQYCTDSLTDGGENNG